MDSEQHDIAVEGSNSSCSPVEPPQKVIIDEFGDLTLIVGDSTNADNHPIGYQVCSRTLARSSPVLKKMLFGSFRESKPTDGDWVINLPDDDNYIMSWLLHLMHGDFESFQTFINHDLKTETFQPLYNFLVAVDYYKCGKTMRPWAGQLIKHLQSVKLHDQKSLYKLSWIYFQLGQREKYEQVVSALVLDSTNAECDSGLPILPPNLIEIVREAREMLINRLMERINLPLAKLWSPDGITRASCCREPDGYYGSGRYGSDLTADDCADRILGATIRELTAAGLWPMPKPSELDMSPQAFSNLLLTINKPAQGGIHPRCKILAVTEYNWDQNENMRGIDYKYTALKAEVEFLSIQWKAIGLEDVV